MRTKSFKSVVREYKAVFFDAFGVLKNHKGLIPNIEQTFEYLEKKVFITMFLPTTRREVLMNWQNGTRAAGFII
jgi:ribonucleotide monophosphatase NagD (HAD superfamily)